MVLVGLPLSWRFSESSPSPSKRNSTFSSSARARSSSTSTSSPHRTRLSPLLICDCEKEEISFLGCEGVSSLRSPVSSSLLGSKKSDPFPCCTRGGVESSIEPPSRSFARQLASSRNWLRFSLAFASSFLLSLALAASDCS